MCAHIVTSYEYLSGSSKGNDSYKAIGRNEFQKAPAVPKEIRTGKLRGPDSSDGSIHRICRLSRKEGTEKMARRMFPDEFGGFLRL
jgi:hypothetical protein